jgi:hypothetical protein
MPSLPDIFDDRRVCNLVLKMGQIGAKNGQKGRIFEGSVYS